MRSDAARNRGRIVEAARALVARDGAAVRMDALATEAGVAVGTLYRHFPTKDALVAAVVEESVEAIAAEAAAALRRVQAGAPAADELDALVRWTAARQGEDRALKAAAALLGADVDLDPATAPPGSAAARACEGVEQLLALARASGRIRPDVVLEDLLVLLAQVPEPGAPERARERYVELLLAGLRSRP